VRLLHNFQHGTHFCFLELTYSVLCFLQLTQLKNEGTTNVDEDLYSLACRPDRRVRSYSACIINGVRYHTKAREAQRKTQNCTIKTLGDHNHEIIDFYGTVIEIIEFNYSANSRGPRTVILLRCEWYNLEGRTYQMKDDGYFKSINIEGRWYKNDPFILATEASQVFLLEDIKFGHGWQVVQDFGHRHIYDVEEAATNQQIHEQVQMRCQEAYQEDNTSLEDCTMGDIDPDIDLLHMDNQPGSPVSAYLVQTIRLNQQTPDPAETVSEDEDETFLEYHSADEARISEEDDSDDD
jgi:hypothetical protein